MPLILIFIAQLTQFAANVLCVFIFFAMGWLYLDSWKVDTTKPSPFLRALGCFLVAIAWTITTTQDTFAELTLTSRIIELAGLSSILVSLWSEPVLKAPSKKTVASIIPFLPIGFTLLASSLLPIITVLRLTIGAVYLVKTVAGLEKQLKLAGIGFMVLALAGLVSIKEFWSDSSIVFFSDLARNYAPLWWIQHLLELSTALIFGIWIWGYIRFRLSAQLFLVSGLSVFAIFIVSTGFLSFLLFKNIERSALSHLHTDANTFQYALEQFQGNALSNARAVSNDNAIITAIGTNNESLLQERALALLTTNKSDFLLIASSSGEVIAQAEDSESIGESLITDPLIASALQGKPLSIFTELPQANNSVIVVSAAYPITIDDQGPSNKTVLGAVKTGFIVDNAFVDGVKDSTGLDVSIFSHNTRAATTFVAPDGTSRYIGTSEPSEAVKKLVLEQGEPYVGALTMFNQPYLAAYLPLRTYQDKIIGMIFVGQPQTALRASIESALSAMYAGSVILMVIAIVPAYFFARYLNRQFSA